MTRSPDRALSCGFDWTSLRHDDPWGRTMDYRFRRLTGTDVAAFKELLRVFGEAFEDRETYQGAVPDDAYLKSLLDAPHFVAVAASDGHGVIGGLAAYELQKFERNR